MSRTRFASLSLLVLVSAACSSARPGPKRPFLRATPTYRTPEAERPPARTPEELLAVVAQDGWVSVMVSVGRTESEPGLDAARIAARQKSVLDALSGSGFQVKHRFERVPYLTLEVDGAALTRLLAIPEVKGVSEEAIFHPLLNSSTNLVDAGWSFRQSSTGAGVAVAVVDGGVAQHSFLGNRIVQEQCHSAPTTEMTSLCDGGGWLDAGPGSACGPNEEYCDHGTHVAGIIAGDSSGISGMARRADIVAMCAATELHRSGQPPRAVFHAGNVVSAMEQVLAMTTFRNFAAVNLSMGTQDFSDGPCDTWSENERAIKDIVDLLRARGVATIVASGNSFAAEGMSIPACITSVFSVGAVDDSAVVAEFSNSDDELDYLAPGVDIVSSVHDGFEALTGTSMAAPHVSGAWALLKGEAPDATMEEIAEALRVSGRTITDSRQERETPLIQVAEALRVLRPPGLLLFPANGTYQTPLELQIDVGGSPLDLEVWITTNGQEPVEDSPDATLATLDAFGFGTLSIDRSGPVTVRAKAFYSLRNGLRLSSPTVERIYDLREPLPGPATVTATDGTLSDRVRVTWTPVPGATGYEVSRSSFDHDPQRFAILLDAQPVTGTSFDHVVTWGTGDAFYYYVRGLVDGFPTLYGGPDLGSAQLAAIPVQASDGTVSGGVQLEWDPEPWKTPGINVKYEVYRSEDDDPSHASLLTTIEGTFINNFPAGIVVTPARREHLDTTAVANRTYYYWVKGIDSTSTSRMGAGERGFTTGS